MSKITLQPVRYYDISDPYVVEVDNRPIFDLATNLELVNTQLSRLGFYREVRPNPQTEPPGGFSTSTCGYIGENGLLYPIDVTQNPLDINYAKYEIVLIVEKRTSDYVVLTFSSEYTLPGAFNSFLPDSAGRAVKIGPGGSLVDELAFDVYYASANLQHISVGKILGPTTIAFGGNQVNTLSNNRFIKKDTNDSTTGLTTIFRNNIDNSTVFKAVVTNGSASAYSFAELQVSSNVNVDSNLLSLEEPIPVYLSNRPLNIDTVTGIFTDTSFEDRLNELHVRTSSISVIADDPLKTRTAVVNTGSLQDFSSLYLLHSNFYSNLANENEQSISTTLNLVPKTDSSAILLTIPTNISTLGQKLDSTTGLPESLLRFLSSSTSRGLSLGGFFDTSSTSGSFIGVVKDTASETALTDSTTSMKMSQMVGSSSLLLYSKNSGSTLTGAGNIFAVCDGYIGLYAPGGVHLAKAPELATEVANKAYVDLAVALVTDVGNKKLTLVGNSESNPITGSLYFDTSNSLEPNTSMKLHGLITCDILSNNPVTFKDLASPTSYQVVQAYTPASGTSTDLTNRGFVESYVTTAVHAALSGTNNPVTLNGTETITGTKTFNIVQNFSAATAMNITRATAGSVSSINTTNVSYLQFTVTGQTAPLAKIKLTGAIDKVTDTSNVLTTKEYVDTQLGTLAGTIPTALYQEYAFWDSTSYVNTLETGSIFKNHFPVSGNRSTSFTSLFQDQTGKIKNGTTDKKITVKLEFNGTFHATDGYASVGLKIIRAGTSQPVTDAAVTSGTNSEGNLVASDRQNPQGVLSLSKMCTLYPGDSFYFDAAFYKAENVTNSLNSFTAWGSITVLAIATV